MRLFVILIASLAIVSSAVAQSLDLDRQRFQQIVVTVAKDIEKNYYDPALRGVNWKGLTKQAQARIDKAPNVGEMYTAVYWLVDQLHDSHTIFIPPSRPYQIQFGFRAKAMGEEIRVYSLAIGGNAAAAGLQLGDRILSVNGFPAERASFALMMLYFGVLRPVALLNLQVARGTKSFALKVEAKTRKVPTDFTKSFSIWDSIRQAESDEAEFKMRSAEHEDGISYLYFPSFVVAETDIEWAIKRVKNARTIILDLRGNHGGYVDRLSEFLGYFDPEATVAAQRVGRDKTEPLKIKRQKLQLATPVIVLVDSESASAAEIFARHLQRSGRAKVIGDRTSGHVNAARVFWEKMGVESIVPYGVEISVARVIFPDGEELEKRGVTPDKLCIPTEDDLRERQDTCLQLAIDWGKKQQVKMGP